MLRRILIYVFLLLAAASTARADGSTVLVFPFENLASDRSLDWIGEGIAELISERLRSEPEVYVFSREERLAVYERLGIPETTMVSRATALKLAWDTGADVIITGRFSGTANDFQIAARTVDTELAESSEEVKAQGRLEDVISLANRISSDLLKKPDYEQPPATPRSAFENYIRGILSADPQKRIDLLRTAVRLYPQYSSAIFQLGRAFHLERDVRVSSQWLEKVIDGSRERLQAQFIIGLNYFYLSDYTRAIPIFRQLPPTYEVLLNLGSAFSLKGDYAAAMAAWKRAAEMDPLASDVFFNIGYASLVKGEFDAAVTNLEQSLKLRGRDSEALFLLGRAYEKQGHVEESQKLLTQATRLSQRIERWLTQPLPKLERLSESTAFRKREDLWTRQRLMRRARGQDLTGWLDEIQSLIDSYSYGQAIRELQDIILVFPESADARALLDEVNERRDSR